MAREYPNGVAESGSINTATNVITLSGALTDALPFLANVTDGATVTVAILEPGVAQGWWDATYDQTAGTLTRVTLLTSQGTFGNSSTVAIYTAVTGERVVSKEDGTFAIVNTADETKKIAFNGSVITTASTRTITMADADVDLADIHTHANKAVLDATTASYTTAEETKLAGIETAATADQTAGEIKTAYESNPDTNAFTDAEKTLLGNQSGTNTGDEVAASTTVAGVVELATVAEIDTGTDNTRSITPAGLSGSALQTKVDGIEAGATADQTGAEIKIAYEGEANTNAFTDALLGKLNGVTLAKSALYAVVAGDNGKTILCDATTAGFNINLLATATAGSGYVICVKKVDASANAITIDGNLAETIDGAATHVLSNQNDSVILISDGTDWHIKSSTTDANAIHSNVAGEIAAVTAKATPTTNDFLLIEDAAATNSKKRITIGDLPSSGGGTNVNVELLAANKTLSDGDPHIQVLDPGGANRNVSLPASTASDSRWVIVNDDLFSDSVGLTIFVGSDVSGYATILYAGASAEFIYDTTDAKWRMIYPITSERTAADSWEDKKTNTQFGFSSKGYNQGSAFGYNANGSNGTAFGHSANGSSNGVAVGRGSNGSNNGTAIGYNAASSSNGTAVGFSANANTKDYSVALGYNAQCQRKSETNFNINGAAGNNALRGSMGYYGALTTTTPTEIFLGGISNERFILRAQSAVSFTIKVVAMDMTTYNAASYEFQGLIKRDNLNNTSIVGSVVKNTIAEDVAGFECSVTADDTNEALIITVTSATTNSTKWVAQGHYEELN